MELYASGHNAWNQLQFQAPSRRRCRRRSDQPCPELGQSSLSLGPGGRSCEAGDGSRQDRTDEEREPWDLLAFVPVLVDDGEQALIHVLRADMSATLVKTSAGMRVAGKVPALMEALYRADAGEVQHHLIAEAANGRVAIADGRSIREYASWHAVPVHPAHIYDTNSGSITQLVSGSTHFVALTNDDAVWTWGDERYSESLGRGALQPSCAPAIVADLQGLPTGPVVKVAAGGHTAAALTASRDCYVWGGGRPYPTPEPTPLDLGGRDVLDVAVGEDHIVVLTDGGSVWVVGDNGNGQLGLGGDCERGARNGESRESSLTEWTEVQLDLPPRRVVVGVAAGPRASFLLVKVSDPRG